MTDPVDIVRAHYAPGGAVLDAGCGCGVPAYPVDFEAESFDAIACFSALIHVPLDRQPTLVTRMASWLRPGGVLLMTAGHRAWTGTDAGTHRAWLEAAGLRVVAEDFVPEGDGGHAFFSDVRGESPACLPA